MSTALDVEALLESAANDQNAATSLKTNADDAHRRRPDRSDRRDERSSHKRELNSDRERRSSRDRERDRKRRDRSRPRSRKDTDDDEGDDLRSKYDRPDSNGSHHSSRHGDRYRRRGSDDRDRDYHRLSGDYYRGGGRYRTRSRSPDRDRRYRPDSFRERRDDRDRDRRGGRDRHHHRETRRSDSPKKTPEPTEDERDKRTVFVQQLAARARTKDLVQFFSKAGPVKEAQIVKDRVGARSKGIGYVEFKDEESVQKAIQLTGQKLLGVPIIAQLTEAEKNREARNTEAAHNAANGIPFHRLYVGNIHFSINEQDLQSVFEPFGELEFVQLQKEEQGRSKGYGFVQYVDPAQAKEALEKLNGFDLAGRPIRVGLGNDKFTPESTANLLRNFNSQNQPAFQGSAFSGHGGRGAYAGGSGGTFDRAGGRDNDKGTSGASALDDTDVAGVNFNNYSRDALMRKLARIDEPSTSNGNPAAPKPRAEAKPLPVTVNQASRCILLKNMFDPEVEQATGENWVKELEDDVRNECDGKYGKVIHIAVDPNTQGDIYVKFERVTGGENALKGLNGRYFGGRMITAQPVVDKIYSSLFSRASTKDM